MFTINRLPRLLISWQFWAGAVLGLGTTGFAPAILYGLLVLQTFKRFRLNIPVLILAAIIGLTSPFTTDWIRPVQWAISVVLLGSLWRHITLDRHFMYGVFLVMLAHLVTAFIQFYGGMDRPQGLNTNASWLGMAGFAAYQLGPVPGLAGSFIVGLSGSRTYAVSIAIMGVWWLWKREPLMVGLSILAGLIFLLSVDHTGHWHRIIPFATGSGSVVESYDKRQSLNNPENVKPVEDPEHPTEIIVDDKPLTPDLWQHLVNRPFGFGYRDYIHETARPLPHNQLVLMTWELGLLAVPFLGVLGYGAWRFRRQWPYLVALIPGILLTAEYYGRLEGVYAIALILLGTVYTQQKRE